MRVDVRPFGLCVALASCASPNPAWYATQGTLDSTASDSASSTAVDTAGSGTNATVEPTTSAGSQSGTSSATNTTEHVGDTDTTTSAPGTSSDTLSTSTSDGDSTSRGTSDGETGQPVLDLPNVDMCPLVAAPELAVAVQHSIAPACNGPLGTLLHGVFEGKPDNNSLKFRECQLLTDCFQGNLQCGTKQIVTVHIDGPATHIPDFETGACVQIGYLPSGNVDPNTCNTRLTRLARIGQNIIPPSVFVAASGVPDTDELPAPWPEVLGFSVAPELAQACGDGESCGRTIGTYDLVGQFSEQEIVVPMNSEKPATIPLLDKNALKIGDVPGTFYDLRSFAHPGEVCDFRWIWLADSNKP